MSIKTYKINSNLAGYTDEEFSAIENLICTEGVFDVSTDDTDLKVTESTPNAMTVDVAIGAALVTFLQNGVTWKVVSRSNAVETAAISANSTGNDRVDAIVLHLKQDEPNALKTNVAEIRVVLGSGTSALADSAITSSLADTNWYRLADVTVPDSAASITNSDITDTRTRVTLDAIPTDGDLRYVTTVGDQTISGTKTYQTNFPEIYSGIAPPTTDYQVSTKKYVDDTIAANLASDFSTSFVYGETITSGNVLYHKQSDNRVYKITSDPDTWGKIIGVAGQNGIAGDTGKSITTRGVIAGSFSAIAPDFDESGTGAINLRAGYDPGYGIAFRLDNMGGAECLTGGAGTVSVKKVGSPTKSLSMGIFLGDENQPYGYYHHTSLTWKVAELTSTSVSYTLISTLFTDIAFTLDTVAIPANSYAWVMFYVQGSGTFDSSNYYVFDAATTGGHAASNYGSWTGNRTYLGNFTLTTTSVDPWDKQYAVKAYGDATDGGFGIGEAAGATPWGRVIGHVLSATEWYLNLNSTKKHFEMNVATNNYRINSSNYRYAMDTVDIGFRPSWMELNLYYVAYDDGAGIPIVTPAHINYITEGTIGIGAASYLSGNVIAYTSALGVIPLESGYYAVCQGVGLSDFGYGDSLYTFGAAASQE
jgi:hypothetical protein